MDPSSEQRLRLSVAPRPSSEPFSLRPLFFTTIPLSNRTPFKKQNSAPTKKEKKHQKHKTSAVPKQPEKEWPCKEEPIIQPSPAWHPMKQMEPDSRRTSQSAHAEEQAKIAGQVMQ
ncbi:hypothetical protein ACJRO7_025134 [Eucalyptus globulus]|uniref:Uncharacterized protein n=1 Tax=Eucalyptus globulus TaxID=34317 RepID=A0ABD3KD94_EUCGL